MTKFSDNKNWVKYNGDNPKRQHYLVDQHVRNKFTNIWLHVVVDYGKNPVWNNHDER